MLRYLPTVAAAVLVTLGSTRGPIWGGTSWPVPVNTGVTVAEARSGGEGAASALLGLQEPAAQEAEATPDLETKVPDGMTLRPLAVGRVEADVLRELGWI